MADPLPLEHLSDTSFLGKLLVFLANVILDWKFIASYKHSSLFCLPSVMKEKKFYNIDSWWKLLYNLVFFVVNKEVK